MQDGVDYKKRVMYSQVYCLVATALILVLFLRLDHTKKELVIVQSKLDQCISAYNDAAEVVGDLDAALDEAGDQIDIYSMGEDGGQFYGKPISSIPLCE